MPYRGYGRGFRRGNIRGFGRRRYRSGCLLPILLLIIAVILFIRF